MPVESDIHQRHMALGREEALGHLQVEAPEDEQHTDANVGAMEACQGKERGAVDASLVEPETLMIELRPLDACLLYTSDAADE